MDAIIWMSRTLLNIRIMTIEEQAKVYSGLDQTLESNNLPRYMANCGFRDGAKWMLEKAIERYSSEIDEINNLLGLIDKNATELIDKEKSIEKFRKSMEESL